MPRKFVTKPCEGCGKDFTNSDPTYPEQKFCTQACSLKRFHNKEHYTKFGKAGGAARAAQRDPAKPSTYLKVPGTDIHVHRAVAEEQLGRKLVRGEVVHHDDENRHNNHPSNLIVFPSQAVHARHHKLDHLGTLCDCPCIRLGGDAP